MSMSGRRQASGNEGIQGNVTADVVAVGRNARATKTVTLSDQGRVELDQAIAQLHQAIAGLQVPPAAQQALKEDVSRLQRAATEDQPDHSKVGSVLENIAGKLKMVGDVTKNAVELFEPLGKIAGLFHLSLAAIGLL
jgi:hypothetical protein